MRRPLGQPRADQPVLTAVEKAVELTGVVRCEPGAARYLS